MTPAQDEALARIRRSGKVRSDSGISLATVRALDHAGLIVLVFLQPTGTRGKLSRHWIAYAA